MNWWQKVAQAVNRWQKAAGDVTMRFAPRWKRWEFPRITFARLVEEGYRVNSAVSACVTTLAFSFPEPPLLAGYMEEGRFVPDYGHKAMELIHQPNPDMGEAELMQFVVAYASIGGNAYLWKQRRQNGSVMALWPFSDVQVTPVPGEGTADGLVKYYEYDAGDGQKLPIPKKDIIHWKWMPDPMNPARGIGAIELSAREVDRDNEAAAYIYSLLKNNAVPPVVITMAEGDEFTQDKADRMAMQWLAKYGRGEGRGGPAFIEFGMKAEQMGFDLQKLAAESLADVPETRIAANFKVPPSVAGLNVGIKRSDYGDAAARKAFTEQTLMALWRFFASELLNGLKDEFAGTKANFALQFDVSHVGALQELKKDQRTSINELWRSGLFTRAQALRELGLKPTPSDEVYFVSLASEFVPAGQGAVVRDGVVKADPQTPLSLSTTTSPHLAAQNGGSGAAQNGGRKAAAGPVLLRVRLDAAKRLQAAVDVWFSQLTDLVLGRVGKSTPLPAPPLSPSTATSPHLAAQNGGRKADLPGVSDLFEAGDWKGLETLVKRYYMQVIELSWDAWNVALGVEKAFDLNDPAVTAALQGAGAHIKEIRGTVLDEVRKVLAYGSENGWGIDDLVRGDATQRGLREVIDETYKNQSRAIARAEMGHAQNVAAANRYRDAGVMKVEILDGGAEDSAPACELANGQVWTVSVFEQNAMQHPNCTRTGVPYFGDEPAAESWPYGFGVRG